MVGMIIACPICGNILKFGKFQRINTPFSDVVKISLKLTTNSKLQGVYIKPTRCDKCRQQVVNSVN